MARIVFDEVDRLIMDKWLEVSELVTAHEAVRDKVRLQFQAVGESLQPWATEQDLEVRAEHREGEFWAFHRDWRSESRDEPWAGLVVGGFSVDDALGADGTRPYACVYCFGGRRSGFNKDVFGEKLHKAIGPKQVALWSEDTSRSCPLNQYVPEISVKEIVVESEKFTSFIRDQFTLLADFIEPVSNAIPLALKAGKAAS